MPLNFNPYEKYRVREFENSGEIRNYSSHAVVDDRRERVELLIAQVTNNKFAIGGKATRL